MKLKKILSLLTSGFIAVGSVVAANIGISTSAADINLKFDLGGNWTNGLTQVSASDGYNAGRGYGFSGGGVKNVGAAGGGALNDAVQFTDNTTTFCVDLPKGLYRISVTLGNTNRTSVYMENDLQIVNMTGNNAYDSILLPVTDGQLNVRAAAGKEGYAFTISEIDVQKVSDDPTYPKTVWMCGDSTVCNYYPIATSEQAGWGQVLDKFIDTSKWQVRNMASSGQTSKGFQTSGQFDTVEHYGKAGDIYIISIGINDTNSKYGISEADYRTCITDMTKRAKAKGMTVYLVKQQGRSGDASNPGLKGRWYGGALDQVGSDQNVEVLDLFNAYHDYCVSIGQDATNNLYIADGLHPNRRGAMKLAEIVSGMIDWGEGVKPIVGGGAVMDTEKTYLIKNKNSGLYMNIDGTAANLTNVVQGTSTGDNAQWVLEDKGSGYYMIKNVSSSFYLDLNEGKTAMGTNIQIYQNSNSSAQHFKFLPQSDGSYVIATRVTSDRSCVEIKNAYTDAGANVQQWEINGHACQSWILEEVTASVPTDPPTEPTQALANGAVMDTAGQYIIKNEETGMYLSAEGKPEVGSNVIQSDCGITDGSVWQFIEEQDGYYRVKLVGFDLYLDLENGVGTSGNNIGIYSKSEGPAQLFKFTGGDTLYSIATKASEDTCCVDIGTYGNIINMEKNRGTSQLWSLEPVTKSDSIISDEITIGDLNGDGAVNCIDYLIMKSSMSTMSAKDIHAADTNADGKVDSTDLNSLMGFLTKQSTLESTGGFYYADEASFSKGVREDTHAGFKGRSYVNLDNCTGSFMEWRVSVPEDGDYKITVSSANGSNNSRAMTVSVNGKNSKENTFLPSGGWESWNTDIITVSLNKGVNTIRLTSASENGGPNIDHITISKE